MQKNIQNYTVIKTLGKGSFAVVYLAENNKTKQIVAVKQITEQLQSPKMMELFKLEVEIMKKIKHRNIIELKEAQFNKDNINMILEYCSQGDLEKYIKKHAVKNRLLEEEAKPIIVQMLEAAKVLRLNNVVHRDLKLSNILIDENMIVKLADFGFAKFQEGQDFLQSYCGSPITMAPEILKRNNYQNNCDIWSLGVMIYQILFTNPPFVPQRGTIPDLLDAIAKQKLTFPQHIPISKELQDLLRKMLVEDPNKRISYEELFQHPYLKVEEDIFQSIMKPPEPQHAIFIQNIWTTIQHIQNQLTPILTQLEQYQTKYPKLEGSLNLAINRIKQSFNHFRIHIQYQNKQVSMEYMVEKNKHSKQPLPEKFHVFSLYNVISQLLTSVYEIALQNKQDNYKELFNLPIEDDITNIVSIQYDNYTILLLSEFKEFQNQQKKGQLLQYKMPYNLKKSDLEILQQMATDRY